MAIRANTQHPIATGAMHQKYLYPLMIGAILLIEIGLVTHFNYFTKNDNAPAIFSLNQLYNQFFSWSYLTYTGVPTISGSLTSILWNGIGFAVATLANDTVASSFFYWTMVLVGSMSVYFIVIGLSGKDNWRTYIGATVAAILFSTPMVQLNYLAPAVFLPLSFLFILRVSKSIERHRHYRTDLFMAIIGTSMALGWLGGFIPNFIIFYASFCILLSLNSKYKMRQFKILILIMAAALLLNMSWLLNPLFFTHSQYTTFFASHNILAPSTPPYALLSDVFAFSSFNYYFLPLYMQLLLVVIFLISMGYLFFSVKRKSATSAFVVSLFSGLILLVGLNAAYGTPFFTIKSVISILFPYIGADSIVWVSVLPFAITIFSILFGMGSVTLLGLVNRSRKLAWLCSLCLMALPLILFAGGILNMPGSPNYSYKEYYYENQTYAIYLSYGVPPYVLNVSSYLNSLPGNFAIATIPAAVNWQTTSWYTGVNVYTSLIYNHPVFSGGTSNQNELISGVGQSTYNESAGIPLSTGTINPNDVSKTFGSFGIKYIILQGDAVNNPHCWCGYYPFSLSRIGSILNESPGVTLYRRFGNQLLYKVDNATPLVTSNVNISYDMVNPTEVVVNIFNATHPYAINFLQTYSPGWALEYKNGTAINSIHRVHGIFNNWQVNSTGTYSLMIYYEPQTMTYAGWAISIATLCALFIYALKK